LTEPVIIVGSGPAGISAAWPLLEAGVAVLMLDASPAHRLPSPPQGDITALRSDPNRWAAQFGADLGGLSAMGDISPKLTTPLTRAALAGYADSIGVSAQDFLVFGSLGAGGLSTVWGGVAAVYDDTDLRGFPFPRSELLPSYDIVKRRIGVSVVAPSGGVNVVAPSGALSVVAPSGAPGTVAPSGAGATHGPRLTPPLQRIVDAAARRTLPANVEIEPATNAVLLEDRDGRGACVNCGLCLWGCHRGSIYASNQELPALRGFPHFTYRPGARARRLLPSADRPGVEVEERGVRMTVTGQRVLLACGAIPTTALVLQCLGASAAPVRLLTNPVAAMAFLVPSLVGASLPQESFALGQLTYRVSLAENHRAEGMLYGADALPLAAVAHRLPLSRPVALRLSRALAPALVLATCYLPGSFSANTILRDGDGADAVLRIEGARTAAADAGMRAARRQLGRALSWVGAYPLPGSLAFSPPGADGHYAGTLPMGGAGPLGTDLCGGLNTLPGVHAVDGAVLSDLPAKHCTLTIMANADRIARRLVHEGSVVAAASGR
jgi:choline dehydrogenase-like flavoprotein